MPNRLQKEKSPYLLQHAANPVDWHPWGEEAFARAEREDKPLFLSSGYATCHWCHVMAHESFEDHEIAALLNDAFICVKVDREERPDVDKFYMTACRLMTGGGGWPLTVIAAPDRRPLFTATYLPKDSRFGRTGLREIIPHIKEVWRTRRPEVQAAAERIMTAMEKGERPPAPGEALTPDLADEAASELLARYDEQWGGFGPAPKFPMPHQLIFLLRYGRKRGRARPIRSAADTLRIMRAGGICDHLGYGFHRYSTDRQWLLPHFEKMLYDQALLCLAYTEAWATTGEEIFRRTAMEIITYVLRDMTDPAGGFYTAEDADSEGEEGKFYLWTVKEIESVLGKEEAALFSEAYGLEEEGNFVEEATGRRTGENILHRLEAARATTGRELPADHREERLAKAREKLFAVRSGRIRPTRDDKILTDWNGLMIAALARAGWALREPKYVEAARIAADMVLTTMRSKEGGLLHMAGTPGVPGFLDDHAFMAWGLLELFQADQDPRWLKTSIDMVRAMLERFWDEEEGGFFQTDHMSSDVLHRHKEVYDGALPSGNSVALQVLLTLNRITEDEGLKRRADRLITAFSGSIFRSPENFSHFLCALDLKIGPFYSVVITGHHDAADTSSFIDAMASEYLPKKIVMVVDPGEKGDLIRELSPVVRDYGMMEGKAAAYACTQNSCLQGTDDPSTLISLMRPVR